MTRATAEGFARRYLVRHRTAYGYGQPVTLCHNQAHLKPRRTARQRTERFRLEVTPRPPSVGYRLDSFGNEVAHFAVEEPHDRLEVVAESEVLLAPPAAPPPLPWEEARDRTRGELSEDGLAARECLLDSQHAPLGAEFAALAAACLPPGAPLADGLLSLARLVFAEFKYDPAFSTVSTPLAQVLRARRGVCQDFAQLAVAALRSVGVAARYVSGYLETAPPPGKPKLVGADASHAWAAAYQPGFGWIDLDPTNGLLPGLAHVTLAWGRDFADVSPLKGVIVGGGSHTVTVQVDVEPLPLGPTPG